MPVSALTLKLKKYRRRFGVLSPRVVVRQHMPLSWFWLFSILFAFVMFGLGWLTANYWGPRVKVVGETDLLRQLQLQHDELALLRSVAGSAQNALSIERAAHQQLLLKIGVLEAENGALKEEMKILERLMPPGSETDLRANKKIRANAAL